MTLLLTDCWGGEDGQVFGGLSKGNMCNACLCTGCIYQVGNFLNSRSPQISQPRPQLQRGFANSWPLE